MFTSDLGTYVQQLRDGIEPEPYPPRQGDEKRLTAILERIEQRLIAIEKKLGEKP